VYVAVVARSLTRTSPLPGSGSGPDSSDNAAGPPNSVAIQRLHAMMGTCDAQCVVVRAFVTW